MSIENGIIDSATIQLERGFALSVWIHLNFDCGSQGFGGFVLGGTSGKAGDHANQANLAAEFICRCMEIAGVEDWAHMKGKVVRVKKAREGFGGTIITIGHPIKNIWLNPSEVLPKMAEGNGK